MGEARKPTDISRELGEELVRIFGTREAVPAPLQETAWLIHMRLVEAENDLAYFRERLAEYTKPGTARPGPAATLTGGYVARLLLSETLVLEVEVSSPFKRGSTLHEKVTFDPRALVEPGVVEALSGAGVVRLLLPNGDERRARLTSVANMWQGKLSIAS